MKYCTKCSHLLNDEDQVCSKCGAQQIIPKPEIEETKHCTKCGTVVSLSTAFCPKCGFPVGSKYIKTTTTEKVYKGWCGIASIVFGLLALAVLILSLIRWESESAWAAVVSAVLGLAFFFYGRLYSRQLAYGKFQKLWEERSPFQGEYVTNPNKVDTLTDEQFKFKNDYSTKPLKIGAFLNTIIVSVALVMAVIMKLS